MFSTQFSTKFWFNLCLRISSINVFKKKFLCIYNFTRLGGCDESQARSQVSVTLTRVESVFTITSDFAAKDLCMEYRCTCRFREILCSFIRAAAGHKVFRCYQWSSLSLSLRQAKNISWMFQFHICITGGNFPSYNSVHGVWDPFSELLLQIPMSCLINTNLIVSDEGKFFLFDC